MVMTSRSNPPEADNFNLIKVISRSVESRLHEAGILSYAKLATLTADDIVALIGESSGVTTERILRQDWIGQASELASRSAFAKSGHETAEAETLPMIEGQGLTSFVVELLMDEEGLAKRIKVMHVATGHEDTWVGWQERRLLDFFISRAGLRIQSTQLSSLELAEAETDPQLFAPSAPVETPDEPADPAPTGGPRLQELQTIPARATSPSWILGANQPFNVRLILDLTEMKSSEMKPLRYNVTVYAKLLGGRLPKSIGKAHGTAPPEDKVAINVKSYPLPRGFYRIQAVVDLADGPSITTIKTNLMTQPEGKLLHVN
jgi:hypothetical protein